MATPPNPLSNRTKVCSNGDEQTDVEQTTISDFFFLLSLYILDEASLLKPASVHHPVG